MPPLPPHPHPLYPGGNEQRFDKSRQDTPQIEEKKKERKEEENMWEGGHMSLWFLPAVFMRVEKGSFFFPPSLRNLNPRQRGRKGSTRDDGLIFKQVHSGSSDLII
ncbi:hypothetical protein CEXT_721411 [Caerostris extrusa]|uniref:Uncharacterized protein n=1 Tax=Caerostris extrusa TaxID=172846 RepID=A0AAV4Q8Y0_CAEEX|nr:hypothetical protein CEXT_721411 [Caerostris extrusa]